MYQVLMFDGGVYKINEFYELVEDIGGFIVQKTQIQVAITITFAIPEEDRPIIEKKTRELGGKLLDVPLAGTEIVVVGPTLGRHHMPHPICDIAESLRRYGAITVVMGLARGKGKETAQISAEEKAIIDEYDAAVFVVGLVSEYFVGTAVFGSGTAGAWPRWLIWPVYAAVPNMQFFWTADALTQGHELTLGHLATVSGYAACMIVAAISLAVALFQSRDVG